MNKKQLKIVTGVAIAVLIVSIIPVFWIGQYLHPFSDDYVFGAETYKIWNATHSISACIQGAWNVAVNMYHIWQGTYSACFLMALQPGAFGAYWIVPILLASSLIMSTYTLLYLIMRKLLHTTRIEFLLVSSVFSLINLQFVYSAYDAFYWYNGAMYYTLYFSMSLCLASLLIAYHYPEKSESVLLASWLCSSLFSLPEVILYQALELLPYFSSPLPSLTWSRRSCQSFSPAFCWFIWLPSLSVFWHQETHSASWP